jgi:hypothetical protein
MWEMFTSIDTLIVMGVMMFFLFGLFIGMMQKSWIIAVIGISLSVITFYVGKHYLDSLEWHETTEIIQTDQWDRLKFSKPVKIQITRKYREGCFLKPGEVLVLVD